tara:strand:- start:252 stop:401 length:150 start_codon:yes stop_codon:yes gene_type:complete
MQNAIMNVIRVSLAIVLTNEATKIVGKALTLVGAAGNDLKDKFSKKASK